MATPKKSLALQAKMPRLLPKAVEECWSVRRLAKEAGCSPSTASKYFSEYSAKIGQIEQEVTDSLPDILREEALACSRSAASRLRAYRLGMNRLIDQMAEEEELDARTVATILQAEERFTNLFRKLTGLDMAEKQAIAQAGKTEVKFEWLGAESLDLSLVVDIE